MEPCEATVSRVEAYLDGTLAQADCAAIEAHAASCATCGPFIAGLRVSIGACRDLAVAPMPEQVRRRALESVRRLLELPPSHDP